MKFFYAKYIEIENLITELHSLDLNDEQKIHLANLIDSSLNHVILDKILSNLKVEDKNIFLNLLKENPENEELIEFLKNKIEGIEEKIKKVSEELIKEMHEDVKKAKLK